MSITQVRLSERVLNLVRSFHPQLESVFFTSSEFKSAELFCQLDWSQSFTLKEVTINPWKSSLMQVDEDLVVNEGDSLPSSKATITVNNAKIVIK